MPDPPISGAWSYMQNGDVNGVDSLTVSITDDEGNGSTQLVGLTISAVADIVNDSLTTSEDTQITARVISSINGASADSFERAALLTGVTQGANRLETFDAADTLLLRHAGTQLAAIHSHGAQYTDVAALGGSGRRLR